MRVLERNAVLSYDRNRPLILRDVLKSDVSKSGIPMEPMSYGHSDL